MFDLGSWGEILIIVVAALVLLGPKELPKVLRTFGRILHHVRRMTRDVRQTFSHYIHEGEFEEYTRTQKPVDVEAPFKATHSAAQKTKSSAKGTTMPAKNTTSTARQKVHVLAKKTRVAKKPS
jgi:Tat protein translocase TatB subunit